MKNFLITLLLSLLSFYLTAQTPQNINYQAVIYQLDGQPLANTSIMIKINIIQGSPIGNVEYSEEHSVSTDQFGIVNLKIGQGTVILGTTLDVINWANGPYFVAEFIDVTPVSTYEPHAVSQLLAVPYALHAANAPVTQYSPNGGLGVTNNSLPCDESLKGVVSYDFEMNNLTYCDGQNWRPFYPPIAVDGTINHVSITGGTNGSIDLSVEGGNPPYYFSWSNTSTTQNIYDLIAGTYSVVVTDNDGNEFNATYTVTEPETIFDIDGNSYPTVKIGNQIWMAQNLVTTKTPQSTSLTDGTAPDPGDISTDFTTPYFFESYTDYHTQYGYLYTWAAAMNGEIASDTNPSLVQGICPDGWHLPSNEEWNELVNFLGTDPSASMGEYADWTCDPAFTNSSFFTSLPGGFRSSTGTYNNEGTEAAFWTTSETDANNATGRSMVCGNFTLQETAITKNNAYAIRCVKNNN